MSPETIIAPLVALAALALILRYGKHHLGPDDDYWELVRKTLLPQLNRLARRNGLGYAAYTLTEQEYLTTLKESPESVERTLHGHGFTRMPLAAYKYTPDGRGEIGSWAWRGGRLLSKYQLHVILFPAEGGGVEVWGHIEYNALHPLYALRHYRGVYMEPLGGLGRSWEYILNRLGSVVENAR